jgi:DHA3 family tetracycline resistance protein-like MFS transporter
LEQFGSLAGVGLSVWLASWWIQLPILIGGALFFPLGLFLIAAMPEHGFKPAPAAERSTWRRMGDTLRNGVGMTRRRPVLLLILGVGFFYGLYSEGFDRLWTAHMLERCVYPPGGGLTPVIWIGIIQAGVMLLTALAAGWLRRRLGHPRPEVLARAMSVTSTLLVAGLVGFALTGQFFVAVALYWAVNVLRQVNYPIYTAWVNHRIDPQVRATVLSLSSQVDAFGQMAGGPLVGWIARATTLQTGLLSSAALLAPVLGLVFRQVRGAGELTGGETLSPRMEMDGRS